MKQDQLAVTINSTPLQVKEQQGQRVVTLKEIDQVHQRPDGTAGRNLNENKTHFISGVDYFHLTQEESRSTNFVERPKSKRNNPNQFHIRHPFSPKSYRGKQEQKGA